MFAGVANVPELFVRTIMGMLMADVAGVVEVGAGAAGAVPVMRIVNEELEREVREVSISRLEAWVFRRERARWTIFALFAC